MFQAKNRGGRKNMSVVNLTPIEIKLLEKVQGIKCGKVTVHIQNGKVVQIDAEEKERLT